MHYSATAIAAARTQGRAALIGYLPVGYPDVPTSISAAKRLLEVGFDAIELGFPYSDPGMDGETIQRATAAALSGGVRLNDLFFAVEQIANTGGAVTVMTYYNPVFHYGEDRFARDLASAGGAGLITPDLIPDEAGRWIAASEQHGLERIFLVAPSSTQVRLERTVAAGRGWIYAASTMGVTGQRAKVDSHAIDLVQRTRQAGAELVCVGLGVKNGQQAKEIGAFADGVIVGSALVAALDQTRSLEPITDLATELVQAVSNSGKG